MSGFRQLAVAGAIAVFVVAVAGGAYVIRQNSTKAQAATTPTAQSSATPQPSPTASAFTGSCKLPVSWMSWGTMTRPLSGGFVTFPGAVFAADSTASGLRTPFGATWVSYDTSMGRWVPVDRQRLSPDGKTWLYGTLRTAMEYHAVDVRTSTDTTLWGFDRMFKVFGLDNTFAYAMLDSMGGTDLWRLPLNGSQGSQVGVVGTWQFVNGGAAWRTGPAPSGAPFSLQRLDLQNTTVSTWVQLSGRGSLVGFDAAGSPIVQVGGPGGDIIVAPSQGVQLAVARAFTFAKGPDAYAQLPAVGDSHGIWLAGDDGIYLSVNGEASKQSSVVAFPAGPCT